MCCFKHHWCQDHFYSNDIIIMIRLVTFECSDLHGTYGMALFITSLIITKAICICLNSAQDRCVGDRCNPESGRSYLSHIGWFSRVCMPVLIWKFDLDVIIYGLFMLILEHLYVNPTISLSKKSTIFFVLVVDFKALAHCYWNCKTGSYCPYTLQFFVACLFLCCQSWPELNPNLHVPSYKASFFSKQVICTSCVFYDPPLIFSKPCPDRYDCGVLLTPFCEYHFAFCL